MNPWWITGFINAELSWIVFIIENKKLKHGLVVLVYIYRSIHKKILILRSTIVLLPNAFWGSTEAPQLQNYRWAHNYSTLPATERRSVDNFKLNFLWVTGFWDGEGCFTVSIVKDHRQKLGWVVQPRFQIGLHSRDKALLEVIKNSLRVGKI